jgi:sugar lactone lactonase YvrE
MRTWTLLTVVGLIACKAEPNGIPLLGDGIHTADAVTLRVVPIDEGVGPFDLAFHPDAPGQAWIVSPSDDGLVVVHDLGGTPSFERRDSEGAEHFMAKPGAIAFGDSGFLATAQTADHVTQRGTPSNFMGPTLWISDPDEFDAGWASHYDMLHNSPKSAGIAWETDNVYWVFDGFHESLTRYDFHEDHGGGGEDHSDGEVGRYVEGEVAFVEGVPSHLVFDASSGLLYVADTGNSRIAALDTSTGEEGDSIVPNYDDSEQREIDGAVLSTVVENTVIVLDRPSGLELRDGVLYVSDNATSIVSAYSLDGALIDWVDLGLPEGSLTGMAFDTDGHLWVADGVGDALIEIMPAP